jgi:hypothetical protein
MKKYPGEREEQDERRGHRRKETCEVESFFETQGSYSVVVMR